jgi:hypothetical protein
MMDLESKPWDFTPVRRILNTISLSPSPPLRLSTKTDFSHDGNTLGDFTAIFDFLDQSQHAPVSQATLKDVATSIRPSEGMQLSSSDSNDGLKNDCSTQTGEEPLPGINDIEPSQPSSVPVAERDASISHRAIRLVKVIDALIGHVDAPAPVERSSSSPKPYKALKRARSAALKLAQGQNPYRDITRPANRRESSAKVALQPRKLRKTRKLRARSRDKPSHIARITSFPSHRSMSGSLNAFLQAPAPLQVSRPADTQSAQMPNVRAVRSGHSFALKPTIVRNIVPSSLPPQHVPPNLHGCYDTQSDDGSIDNDAGPEAPFNRRIEAGAQANAAPTSIVELLPVTLLMPDIASTADYSRFLDVANKHSVRMYHSTDRHHSLLMALIRRFPDQIEDLLRLESQQQRVKDGIHVFVDFTNILYGFQQYVSRRGFRGEFKVGLAFDSLALLLERRRPVAKRVVAGGSQFANYAWMAKSAGYRTHVLRPVLKPLEKREQVRIAQKQVSQAESGEVDQSWKPEDEKNTPILIDNVYWQWQEQCVDEILHLEIATSMLESDPGTMVIATGDGARAGHSKGFAHYAEMALRKGWKIELFSFKDSRHSIWNQLKKSYKGQVSMITGEDFFEYLMYT